MSETIVDALEEIEIDERHGERLASLAAARERSEQPRIEHSPHGDAGQRILVRLAIEHGTMHVGSELRQELLEERQSLVAGLAWIAPEREARQLDAAREQPPLEHVPAHA